MLVLRPAGAGHGRGGLPARSQAVRADEVFDTPGTFQRHEQRMRGIPLGAGFRPYQPYEAGARVLRMFEHSLVPGLFQTEDYARETLRSRPEVTEQEVNDALEARMARQAVLSREDPPPPRIWAVPHQHVLDLDIGSPAVMLAQVQHLAELARLPRVNIQVLPPGRLHAGWNGAFAIADTGTPPAIAYPENASDGQTLEDPEAAESMALLSDALRMEALTGSASLACLEEAVQRRKERAQT